MNLMLNARIYRSECVCVCVCNLTNLELEFKSIKISLIRSKETNLIKI